jgi:hypothetical protein
MCLPDLAGSQGIFHFFTSDPDDQTPLSGGLRHLIDRKDQILTLQVPGPPNPFQVNGEPLHLQLTFRIQNRTLLGRVGKHKLHLKLRDHSPWIRLEFKAAPGIRIRGICRLCLLEIDPHVRLYMTPIQIDPEYPALPISYPTTYSIYLAKTQGIFATLGLAEDTNALKSGILDEDLFLKQAFDIQTERERMFFDALEKTHEGLVACVFDQTDRLQHMFFRYLDPSHPGNRGRDTEKNLHVIRDLYIRMDELVGKTLKALGNDSLLLVMSDHGFASFRRGVNLNTWLYQAGYLVLNKANPSGVDYFTDVDWTRTRAYALGFGGIYLNRKGRESQGIVTPEEVSDLKKEISLGLSNLIDKQTGDKPVSAVYDTALVYSGPYVGDAPDLCVGFKLGYRAATLGVTGGIGQAIFSDNTDDWSGDHNFNPPEIPGMLFSNFPINSETVSILDIAPTVLDLFGVGVPDWMDGHPMQVATIRHMDSR